MECDLEKSDQIGPALGNASVVICCIGASEKEVFDITGPYRIDYLASKNLIDAATAAKVKHFILLTSLGTNKVGFPAAILNLFWGVLIWKRKAEEALLASGLPYTIVRPGGMERPTDAYKETHNITLSQEDTLFGGQVSNLQVAELMAVMAKNRSLSYCKVVEVIAETTAPLTPMEELLVKIPSQRADIYSPKESVAAAGPDLAPSKTVKSKEPSPPIEQEPSSAKATARQPLSPYIVYEDLKPPTSPTPTPSTTAGATKPSNIDAKPAALKSIPSPAPSGTIIEKEPTQTEVRKPRPLSPYTCYEDLKPPSSPSPPSSGSKETPYHASTPVEIASPSTGGNDVAKAVAIGIAEKVPPQSSTNYYSPYPVYDDFKPPTSPSPNAPTVSLLPTSNVDAGSNMATLSVNNIAQSPTADKPRDKQQHTGPKPRPLSPFTMYDDLKPPTSPIPSPRKS